MHSRTHTTIRFGAALLLAGVMAGCVGATCQWILHSIEHLVWDKGGLADHTLIEGAMFTTPQHRFFMLVAAGLLAAASWGLIVYTGTIPHISTAMGGGRMPILRTVWHSLTQIVIVALGASAGREAAPREITSAMGARIGDFLGLDSADRRLIVGSAAAAGLAAVYSIPFSGFFFALEVMLLSRKPRAILAAFVVNAVAVLISSGGDFSHPFYHLPPLDHSAVAGNASITVTGNIAWVFLGGTVLGVTGYLFRRGVRWAESNRPETLRLTWTLPLTFTGVGALAAITPTILGNGQASAQTFFYADHYMLPGGLSHLGSFDPRTLAWVHIDVAAHFHSGASLTFWAAMGVIMLLTAAKAVATLVTIRSGAWGGTLTPALAVGAGISAALGLIWGQIWPGTPLAEYVLIGAAAYLGVTLNAPITGMALLIEFTRTYDVSFMWTLIFTTLVAFVVASACEGAFPEGGFTSQPSSDER